jgi:hypothetical protein
MYYYINSSGQQAGPVPANQLAANGVTGETLVWKAGMSQWTKAAEVAELQFMFGPQRPYQPQNQGYQPQNQGYQPQNQAYQPQNQAYQPQNQGYQPQQNTGSVQRKPDNHMVMAVICTICCCLPLGAYSIYCAAQVDGAFRGGMYDKAEEWAQKAKKWATWGFVGGAIVNILYMLIYGAEAFSQFS